LAAFALRDIFLTNAPVELFIFFHALYRLLRHFLLVSMLIWHSIFCYSKFRLSFVLDVLPVCAIVEEMPGVKEMVQQHCVA
jgi:hypothetical protein